MARVDVWAHPLVGLVEWLALVGTIFGSCVRWRGISYRLLPRGRIVLTGREDEAEDVDASGPLSLRERVRVRAASVEGSNPQLLPEMRRYSSRQCELRRSRVQALTLTLSRRERGPGQAPAFLPTRQPRVVLWDTRKLDVSKDFAGGFGIGQYCGDGSFRSRVIRHFYKRDRRPSSLLYAYLAAIFARLGYRVEYAEDSLPGDADLYVFNPSLLTLPAGARNDRRLAQAPAAGAGAGRGHAGLGAARPLRRP